MTPCNSLLASTMSPARAVLARPAVQHLAVLPPGTEKLTLLGTWVFGLVGFGLFVCFAVGIGKAGWESLTSGHYSGGKGPAVCLVCAVFLGAASAIFAAIGAGQ